MFFIKQFSLISALFFFNDTATTEIYTLSPTRRSSDLLPVHAVQHSGAGADEETHPKRCTLGLGGGTGDPVRLADRKSTRLNSSHANISYAVFCLKKNTSISRKHCTSSPNIEQTRMPKE